MANKKSKPIAKKWLVRGLKTRLSNGADAISVNA